MVTLLALFLLQDAAVASVEGDVEYRQPSKSKKWAKLPKDAKLSIGDQVQTGLKSRCLLRVGESTLVLIRASSFATLSQAFIDKNKVEGELRLDLGSVLIEVDDQKVEQVDFKVSTPMGTASIRGSGMVVTFSEFGMDVEQTQGTIFARGGRHPESRLTEHARQKIFASMAGGDLAALIGLMMQLRRRDGDPPLQTEVSGILQDPTFRDTLDFNQGTKHIGGTRPRYIHTGTPLSFLTFGPYVAWSFQFLAIRVGGFDVNGLTRLSKASYNANLNEWTGFVGPHAIWRLRDVGATNAIWEKTFVNGRVFRWDENLNRWIPQ